MQWAATTDIFTALCNNGGIQHLETEQCNPNSKMICLQGTRFGRSPFCWWKYLFCHQRMSSLSWFLRATKISDITEIYYSEICHWQVEVLWCDRAAEKGQGSDPRFKIDLDLESELDRIGSKCIWAESGPWHVPVHTVSISLAWPEENIVDCVCSKYICIIRGKTKPARLTHKPNNEGMKQLLCFY